MKLLGIDFETNSVDPKTCRPIEFAGQIYDTTSRKRGEMVSQLIWESHFPPLTPDIEEITGIKTEEAKTGVPVAQLLELVEPLVNEADILVAYNAPYDRKVLERCFLHVGRTIPQKPWLCMMTDVPYPERFMRCRQLSHRAFDHKIPMDGRKIHRAAGDVEIMWDILDLYDPKAVLDFWAEPWVYLNCQVPGPWQDGGRGKEWARAQGFGWEKANGDETRTFPKMWVKRLKRSQVNAQIAKFDQSYPVQIVT